MSCCQITCCVNPCQLFAILLFLAIVFIVFGTGIAGAIAVILALAAILYAIFVLRRRRRC